MKDIYGHKLPIIEDNIMGYFDNAIVQINKAQKDLAADNAAAAKAEYGRGLAMISVPLSSLMRLLDAGDYLQVIVGPVYVQDKADWREAAGVIRNFISDQS